MAVIKTSVLRVKVGPWGGMAGSPWDEGGDEDGGYYTGIRGFRITRTWCIQGFMVEYDNNGKPVQGPQHGDTLYEHRAQRLDYPDEFLTHVSGYHDNYVRSLLLKSNRGRTFRYGTPERDIGARFSCSVDNAGAVVGFSGRSGSFVDAISLYIAVWNPDRFYRAMREQRILAVRVPPLLLVGPPPPRHTNEPPRRPYSLHGTAGEEETSSEDSE